MVNIRSKMRPWVPRFSLRMLLFGVMLIGSGYGLWLYWEPWTPDFQHGALIAAPDGWLTRAPDGRRLSRIGGQVQIQDSAGRRLLDLPPQGHLMTAFFSPDGRFIISTPMSGPVRIWDSASGKQVMKLDLALCGTLYASYSPDGRTIMAYGGTGVILWDSTFGRELFQIYDTAVACVRFSPDCNRLAVLSPDSSNLALKLWDLKTETKAVSIKLKDQLDSVAFSTDGLSILMGNRKVRNEWDSASVFTSALRRRHPEQWWGVAWLPEFWLTVVFAGALVWSGWRDRKPFGASQTARNVPLTEVSQ